VVQVYNPTAERDGLARGFSLLREFTRLNWRLHDKSLTADRTVTILGGRNIGDEHFDADPEMNFRDRDVAVVGPAASSRSSSTGPIPVSRIRVPPAATSPRNT
jgi:phosphatidylserine/phosphatidylglycerophosphate/cardiolipin synthase-like enzyme